MTTSALKQNTKQIIQNFLFFLELFEKKEKKGHPDIVNSNLFVLRIRHEH